MKVNFQLLTGLFFCVFIFMSCATVQHVKKTEDPIFRGEVYQLAETAGNLTAFVQYKSIDSSMNSIEKRLFLNPRLGPEMSLKVGTSVCFKLDKNADPWDVFWDIREPLLSMDSAAVLHAFYVEKAPVIDGELNDSCWEKCVPSTLFEDIQGKNKEGEITQVLPTYVKVCFDHENLYVGATLVEPHVCATLTTRDTIIFNDNDFELFLDPTGNHHNYAEIEVNALNTVWDLLITKPYKDQGTAITSWNIQGLKTAIKIDGTLNKANDLDTAWFVEMSIPFNALGACGVTAMPAMNSFWRVNFSRVQWDYTHDLNGYKKVPNRPEYNWVWAPTGIVAIHHPERWGYLVFVDHASTQKAPIDPIVSELNEIYYAERAYYQNARNYCTDIKRLSTLFLLPQLIESRGYILEQTPQGWRASFKDIKNNRIYRMIQDGRLEVSPSPF